MALSLSFPDSTYSSSNKPSSATLKADIQAVETAFNALETSVATKTGVETLTNKTLTKPTIDGHVTGSASYTPGVGATATLDCAADNRHSITMPAGNITIALSNITVGQIILVEITQDGGGSRTVTWFSTIRWAGGSAPTLTTTASKRDVFGFICTGSGTYDGYVIAFNI